MGIGTAEEAFEGLSDPWARVSALVCGGLCNVADLVVPSEDRRLRSSSRVCISAFTRKLFISSIRCSCEIPLMYAPLRIVTFSAFVPENMGGSESAKDLERLSDVASACAGCLAFTAVKPVGGDWEDVGTPFALVEVPLTTSKNVAGLPERWWPLTSSASRRLIMAAFRFFKR